MPFFIILVFNFILRFDLLKKYLIVLQSFLAAIFVEYQLYICAWLNRGSYPWKPYWFWLGTFFIVLPSSQGNLPQPVLACYFQWRLLASLGHIRIFLLCFGRWFSHFENSNICRLSWKAPWSFQIKTLWCVTRKVIWRWKKRKESQSL